jgi:hypothetical protein
MPGLASSAEEGSTQPPNYPATQYEEHPMKRMSMFAGCLLSIGAWAGSVVVTPYSATASEPRLDVGSDGIAILTADGTGGRLQLSGPDAGWQLIVMRETGGGRPVDATRTATYEAAPPGIVEVSPDGWVEPRQNGVSTVTARTPDGTAASVEIVVSSYDNPPPINFATEVVPVFTKYGCNGGGCHGKSGGQNGFRLSLLGFEPEDDFATVVQETRGRRVFPAAPRYSLLLRKATGEVPHGGGERFAIDSPPYRTLARWIEQGMPTGSSDDPFVTEIEVLPRERVLQQHEAQQVVVLAHDSDGGIRDVTRVAQYESADPELAEATARGLVTAGQNAGSVVITVRYQSHVDVFRATVPLGAPVERLPVAKNVIDSHVFAKLKQLGLPPSEICDDNTFIRRVTLDIAGRLPTAEELDALLDDGAATRRERLVDRLLDSTDYAEYFANKWSAILRNQRDNGEEKYATFAFHDWIRQSLFDNKPYDRFVRELVAASGQVERNPAVAWYNEVRDQAAQVEDVCQLFLGLRIGCARCHHHPAEAWSQQDYYGMSAFFSRIGRKRSQRGRAGDHIFHQVGTASAANPRTGKGVPPTPLGDDPLLLGPQDDPRRALADWMTSPDNPFFAKALVNRYWKHFFGRGLVEPEDDMRVTNPATHPELLDELASEFVNSGYDLKVLIRTMCTSSTYALSSLPNEYNAGDKQSYSRSFPRRLPAEVLLDAIDTVTGAESKFSGVPINTRAVALPDSGFNSYFLRVFGRPDSASACECERSGDVNLAQCLHLLNSEEVRAKTASGVEDLTAAGDDHAAAIQTIYLTAYSRSPTEQELATAVEYLVQRSGSPEEQKKAYEDLLWVIINTKEFLFNH